MLFCCHLSSFKSHFAVCLQVCFEMAHKKASRVGTFLNLLAACLNKNGPLLCPDAGLSSFDDLVVLQTLLLLVAGRGTVHFYGHGKLIFTLFSGCLIVYLHLTCQRLCSVLIPRLDKPSMCEDCLLSSHALLFNPDGLSNVFFYEEECAHAEHLKGHL